MSQELHHDDSFMESMDNMTPPYGWRRSGDNPTTTLHEYLEAKEKDPKLAGVLFMKYMRITSRDAVYFGVEPLELFKQHLKGLEYEYSTFNPTE